MKRLSQTIIKQALPQDNEYYIWDHQVPGLGCRILPSNKKRYYFRYVSPVDKVRRKIMIGDASILDLEEAREIATEYKKDVSKHLDPIAKLKNEIDEKNKSLKFGDFWVRFDQEYIKEKHYINTQINNKCNVRRILDFFRDFQLDTIAATDILKFKSTIKSPYVFALCISLLKNCFKHAEICELRSWGSNPCMYIEIPSSKKRQRFLNQAEMDKVLIEIKNKIAEKRNSPYPYYALLCLIYSGQRKNEIVKLKWEDINFNEEIAELKKHKTVKKVGTRQIILNNHAISVIKQVPKIEGNPYIFCGIKRNNSYTRDIDSCWDKVRTKLNLEDVRIHDLRHTFASMALANKISLYEVSKLLGHTSIRTTERYGHLCNEDLKRASNQVFK